MKISTAEASANSNAAGRWAARLGHLGPDQRWLLLKDTGNLMGTKPVIHPTSESMPDEKSLSCERVAARLGVSPKVHDDDFIFQFCNNHPGFPTKDLAINYYFEDGANSAKKVRCAVDRWMGKRDHPLNILEFASGYGAVTRHAKKELEPHVLTSCDIHPQAIEFLSKYFHVKTMQSQACPEGLEFAEKYDVIFVLSFFSHMPRGTWYRWLSRLYSVLSGGGILLFTTHGKVTLQTNAPQAVLDEEGYWFSPGSEQLDLEDSTYGTTITLKKFVDARIALLPGVDYIYFEQAGWWNHQDVYIVRKEGI